MPRPASDGSRAPVQEPDPEPEPVPAPSASGDSSYQATLADYLSSCFCPLDALVVGVATLENPVLGWLVGRRIGRELARAAEPPREVGVVDASASRSANRRAA